MAMLKCKMCGGNLIPDATGRLSTCEYCGTVQTVPTGEDAQKLNLFNRANRLRLDCEFDKAAALYEKLVTEFPEDAEGYWGLCLSKYGIEYVDDPATGKKVPTCHRASYDAITADPDYRAALDRADAASRAVYMEQGYAIDTLQRGIMEIARTEKPFDVFLCYKETDAAGRRTPDSVIANDIYYQLTNEGFKVFYAAITLENKLGQAYEPYIFAALHSAKVMLVIGTAPEYFNAVWVRNEWSRFLKLMKTDRTKLLIPCYKDMDAYELPEEFSHLQAQDMGKIGFITDVIRGIKKVLQKDAGKGTPAGTAPAAPAAANVESLLTRGALALEDGDFAAADGFFEQVLNQDARAPEAYLGKLMASLGVKNRNALRDLPQPFDQDPNYQKALRFGDEKLKADLTGAIAFINERNENARKEGIYQQGLNLLNASRSEQDYRNAADCFRSIMEYRDADEMVAACEDARKEWIYQQAQRTAEQSSVAALQEAIRLLKTIPGYQDADVRLTQTETALAQLQENAARAKSEQKKKTGVIAAVLAAIVVLGIVLGVVFGGENTGKYITFGAYEQDNDASNGKEPIEWLVLEKQGSKALVVSRYALDCKPYNTEHTDVTWETCTLRKWLNNDFLNAAFSETEQGQIISSTVTADKNPSYSTSPGNETTDKVFLLSIPEAYKYFKTDSERICGATDYAAAQGAYTDNSYSAGGKAACLWWLRSPGDDSGSAAFVSRVGFVGVGGGAGGGSLVDIDSFAVRPALWIDLES